MQSCARLRSGEVGCPFLVCSYSPLSCSTFLHRGAVWDAVSVGSFQGLSDSRQLLFPALIQGGVHTSRALGKALAQPHSGKVPAAQSPSPGSPKRIIIGILGEAYNRSAQAPPHRWQWPFMFLVRGGGRITSLMYQGRYRNKEYLKFNNNAIEYFMTP